MYEKDEEMIDFLHSLKFNVIVGDTLQLLEYIKEYNLEHIEAEKEEKDFSTEDAETFAEYMIPNNDNKLISYPFEEYFVEYSPRWSYIYSNQIYRTIHYRKIVDAITKNQDVIVIGMRATGKTTLLMQRLADYQTDNMKHYMIYYL